MVLRTALLGSLHIKRLNLLQVSHLLCFLTLREATSVVGTVAHECTVTPVMNKSYSKTVKSRVQVANQPKRQVQMLSEANGVPEGSYLYNPKTNSPFGKFTGGRSKAEAQNNKATRIPKNELLDLLFKCFQEYAYWSLKGLREYVKQPEVMNLLERTDISLI
jgi:transcription initiation factor TFIIF subunit beta